MATIKDVAERAGLNVGTVSRIINNRGYISPQTRERVLETMKELNYQPNEVARSLSKRRTRTIAMIVPQVSHPYFARLIECVEQAAADRDYKLVLYNSRLERERMSACLELCRASRVDGAILLSGEVDSSLFSRLDLPLVSFERWPDERAAVLRCDNAQGGALAARCLIAGGCRRLLCFGSTGEVHLPANNRVAGFTQVCADGGVAVHTVTTEQSSYLSLDYYDAIRAAFARYPDADGVFTGSDVIAAQVLQICAELGRRVPDDVQVVGFDDVLPARLTIPPLTTIRQPIPEMAAAALDLLEQQIRGEQPPPDTMLPVSLIRRGSTKGEL